MNSSYAHKLNTDNISFSHKGSERIRRIRMMELTFPLQSVQPFIDDDVFPVLFNVNGRMIHFRNVFPNYLLL